MLRLIHTMALIAVATGAAAAATPERPLISGVSHIAVYTSDAGRAEHLYVHDLGALKADDPESSAGVRYYFAPTQFVEVLPLPGKPPSINRLDHVAFTTADAERLRVYLAAQGIVVPKQVMHGRDGGRWFAVTA